MVGIACHEPNSQRFPFPLRFLGYPNVGNFIGSVGILIPVAPISPMTGAIPISVLLSIPFV